ncbi:MAG: DUF5713 family protein [Oscillospiraceae bacterium]
MKKFDENYVLVSDMVNDDYFPDFLVEKIKALITKVINLLENGETDKAVIQRSLDEMTIAINDLEEEFEENDSEIETVARDSIAETIEDILRRFDINIDAETALRERDW